MLDGFDGKEPASAGFLFPTVLVSPPAHQCRTAAEFDRCSRHWRRTEMSRRIGVLGFSCVLMLHGCFDNDHNQDKAKDQSKPSLQMQQTDEKK
jgi:hypothetical protein